MMKTAQETEIETILERHDGLAAEMSDTLQDDLEGVTDKRKQNPLYDRYYMDLLSLNQNTVAAIKQVLGTE